MHKLFKFSVLAVFPENLEWKHNIKKNNIGHLTLPSQSPLTVSKGMEDNKTEQNKQTNKKTTKQKMF